MSKWAVSFWLVRRKAARTGFDYSVLRVDIDARLNKRFKGYVKEQVQDRAFHLDAYDFNNADPDDVLLTLDADATDFHRIVAAIDAGFDNPRAKEYSDLLSALAYVVVFESGGERLFALRKINTLNNPKKAVTRQALFFDNHKLVDVEDKQVFMIDPRFDFFVFGGTTFIASKAAFETAMNFREGIKEKGNELLDAFTSMDFLSDVEPIRTYVGENLRHLRKLAAIKNAGYFKQPDYMTKLIAVVKAEKWDLKIVGGKIIVEEETMELLLKLLNNDRLRSPINDEMFDSSAKTAVAGASTGA
ncbi:DUF4868 domain-containing protein [Hydrogenophaga sp.]|uniref:DUF4868 domain-containing protein n=1 Tax=Hydrogenophaga sp. TaxID=1904254 RepID=UPI0025C459DB|nr:DUF4868 domain-containing protein [Hydrogenophaga sp.]